MAKVVNFSHLTVEVFGADSSLNLAVFELEPRKQTADDFDVFEVRPSRNASAEIFESEGWWRIHTDYAYVNTFDTGIFWDDLSLHCVPFRSASGSPPWARGYEPAAPDAARDALPLSTPQVRDPEHARGPFDGELDDIPDADFDFGIQVRTTIGTTTYITLRLDASPHWSLSDAEEENLRSAVGPDIARIDYWKSLIEQVWATAAASGARRIACELDWAPACHHNSINVFSDFWKKVRLAFGTIYTGWSINLDKNRPTPAQYPISAHEFGHHLGLNDGYVIDLELKYLLGNPAIDQLITSQGKSVKVGWHSLAKLVPSWIYGLGERRAQKRLAGGQCSPLRDIMDDQFRQEPPAGGLQIIDAELVESILMRRPQSLCYTTLQFDKYTQ